MSDFLIAHNFDLYGCCKSVVAYSNFKEVGRAVYSAYPKPNWLIGPSGIPSSEDLDLELEVDYSRTSAAEVLAKVDTLLRFSISAANAFNDVRAA